jgi:hypothetical protein
VCVREWVRVRRADISCLVTTPTAKETAETVKPYCRQSEVSTLTVQYLTVVWKLFQDRAGLMGFRICHTMNSD